MEQALTQLAVKILFDDSTGPCLFNLILYAPSTIFSYVGTGLPGLNHY